MKKRNLISKAATFVVFASLASAVAPALAAGPGGGDSGSGDAMGGANATGNKTLSPGAPNGAVGHNAGGAMAPKGMMHADSSHLSTTTGSGLGGGGTTESHPSNTK